MRHSRIFLSANIFFIFGVALRSFFAFNIYIFFLLAGACLVFLITIKDPTLHLLFIGGIFLFFGILRYHMAIPNVDEKFISFYNSKKVEVTGNICREIDERIKNNKITLCASSLAIDGREREIGGKILLTARLYPKYFYGEKIRVAGKLLAPEPFENFSYERYLARYDVYSLMYYPEIEVLGKERGNYLYTKILKVKEALVQEIQRNLPEPQAGVLIAILFGNRGWMPQEIQNQMSQSGIIHLIAISGSHITLFIIILSTLAPYFSVSRSRAFYGITVLIIFYITLIGAPASAVRAGIMGWLGAYAAKNGRLSEIVPALLFSAALMILENPFILRDDIGFQLSFLSVWGMATFIPRWEKNFTLVPSWFGMRTVLLMTLASYLATLPLVIYSFGRVSLLSPLSNLLTVPTFPFLFLAAAFSFFLSFIFPGLSEYIFFLPSLGVSYLIGSGRFFSSLPYAHFSLPSIPPEFIVAGYFAIIYYAYLPKISQHFIRH